MAVKKKRAVKKKAVKKKKKALLKKKTAKKAVKKAVKKLKKKKTTVAQAKKAVIGTVTHYFPHVNAAVIKLKAPLSVGDAIKIKGHTTDFTQKVDSIQIDRVPVNSAKKGEEVGVLVGSRVRQHDVVYKA